MAHPMIPAQRPRVVNTDALEKDMQKALAEQRNTTLDHGTITAEMALQQFKTAAAAVLTMGDEVTTRIERCEAHLADLHDTMRIVQDAANAISDRGAAVYKEIERANAISVDIRNACAEFVKKVGA